LKCGVCFAGVLTVLNQLTQLTGDVVISLV
jgi:hypothetical protein